MGIVAPQKCPRHQVVDSGLLQARNVHVVVVVCLWELGFPVFGFELWFKLRSPSVCSDYSTMGFYLWSCNRSKQKETLT